MKIILWGSTGLTGREVLSQALEDGHEVKAVVRKPKQIIRRILKANYDDIRKAETVLAGCNDLDWIGIRPMKLMNTPRTGKYRTAVNFLPPGGVEISRADVAEFMLKQMSTDEHLRSYVTIAQ